MLIQDSNEPEAAPERCDPKKDMTAKQAAQHRPNHLRLLMRVPHEYQQEPIISRLVSEHELMVIVKAAVFESGACLGVEGWFDLELHGTQRQIDSGLIYLEELDLDIEILTDPEDIEDENW
jgi:hypothetical protein